MADEFDAAPAAAWVVVAYLVTQTAGAPLWGKVSDITSRRACMLFCVAVFTVASVAAALASSMGYAPAPRCHKWAVAHPPLTYR